MLRRFVGPAGAAAILSCAVVLSAAGLAAATFFDSCVLSDSGPAQLWTDVPETVLAVELFNASQDRYLIEVHWKAYLAESLRQAGRPPALAMGRLLKSQTVHDRFQSLDYLFGELVVNQSAFYPGLLALGNIEGRQLLLPVSFNLPTIIFAKGLAASSSVKNDFVLSLEDMASASAAFNQKDKGAYVRMGFSPRWDGNFLTLAVNAAGAAFKEGRPLAWNEAGLRTAVDGIRSWVTMTNGSASLEDDFQFKYLYTPAYQYVSSGRTLFAYLDSASFFLIPEEKRSALDYRWFVCGATVPMSDDIVFAAILRAGEGKQAAEAFLKWFFREDSQKAMLENARRTRAQEGSFGIAGGFSAVRSVNEKDFPLYYPSLVGHLPPADALAAPNILPTDWPDIKNNVLAPWLIDTTRRPAGGASPDPSQELAARIVEYLKRAAPQQ